MAEASQVQPQQAREFVSQFVPDPKMIESMDDNAVVAYHGKLRGNLDTQIGEAVKARGEFGPEWRKALVGDNPDELKTVERFKDPKELYKSYNELRTKLSKGDLKVATAYPEKGTSEQQAQWRLEQGIPAEATGYKLELQSGQVLGDDDKPIVESFLKAAHAANMQPGTVNAAVQWFLNHREEQTQAMGEANKVAERDTEDELRKDWGDEYRTKMTTIDSLLDSTLSADSKMRPMIANTVKRNPEFAKWIDGIAHERNPYGVLPPGDHSTQAKAVEDEIATFQKMMRTNRSEYNQPKNQERYRQLLEMKERLDAQSKRAA